MPAPLDADQLESISRLMLEPLRVAVRAEISAGHEKLAAAIDRLAANQQAHVQSHAWRIDSIETQLRALSVDVAKLRRFRFKLSAVLAAISGALGYLIHIGYRR